MLLHQNHDIHYLILKSQQVLKRKNVNSSIIDLTIFFMFFEIFDHSEFLEERCARRLVKRLFLMRFKLQGRENRSPFRM